MLKLTRQNQFSGTQIVHVKRESERENKCGIVVLVVVCLQFYIIYNLAKICLCLV